MESEPPKSSSLSEANPVAIPPDHDSIALQSVGGDVDPPSQRIETSMPHTALPTSSATSSEKHTEGSSFDHFCAKANVLLVQYDPIDHQECLENFALSHNVLMLSLKKTYVWMIYEPVQTLEIDGCMNIRVIKMLQHDVHTMQSISAQSVQDHFNEPKAKASGTSEKKRKSTMVAGDDKNLNATKTPRAQRRRKASNAKKTKRARFIRFVESSDESSDDHDDRSDKSEEEDYANDHTEEENSTSDEEEYRHQNQEVLLPHEKERNEDLSHAQKAPSKQRGDLIEAEMKDFFVNAPRRIRTPRIVDRHN
uniref:AlNc14C4G564 protein n=1 Tax=Albugo laibachii Nc14 TaxID=890382 RepID=F0W0C1_9STRA|nr:AlNc14C4G564 [Albugo laibachii Nc14]|eukprot:CCA14493.1 AlNc14C4G564 [Albugo laibachii Nc14]